MYLYGYTSEATVPPYKLQGFNIGARKQDVIYVSLIDSDNASTPTTYAAKIVPSVVTDVNLPTYGDDVTTDAAYTAITRQQYIPGDLQHPLQYDAALDNWYLRVTAATSGSSAVSADTGYAGIHEHLGDDVSILTLCSLVQVSYAVFLTTDLLEIEHIVSVMLLTVQQILCREILSTVTFYNLETYRLVSHILMFITSMTLRGSRN